eukprot:GILK01002114.1.p1 GENE.GILK01002114.1~~GILK01002114.1.p1  ORF type:complete len:470 (+),score=51.67 GILK01002114.1:200-1609(+)
MYQVELIQGFPPNPQAPFHAPPPVCKSGRPEKTGALLAFSRRSKEWKIRHFKIKDNFLHYYRTFEDSKPDGVIPLEGCTVYPVADREHANALELFACNRNFLFAASSPREQELWIHAIKAASELSIDDLYEIHEMLGSGSFSVVCRGTDRVTGLQYAIKIVDKAGLAEHREHLLTEISILKTIHHPHIVSLKEIFETRTHMYIVMELLSGGQLFDRVIQQGSFSEKDAAHIIQTIAGAVDYLHAHSICHRDLKPENLLYDDSGNIKIADFGLSRPLSEGQLLVSQCGTPGYIAPEVLAGNGYGKEIDMWSLGVILFILLCGYPPFYADTEMETFDLIKACRYEFADKFWSGISLQAKDLVSKLLRKNPADRLTASQVLRHPWICSGVASSSPIPVIEAIIRFKPKLRQKRGRILANIEGASPAKRLRHFEGANGLVGLQDPPNKFIESLDLNATHCVPSGADCSGAFSF